MQCDRDAQSVLCAFRGLPDSGGQPDKGVVSLQNAMEVVVQRFRIGQVTPEMVLLERWDEIVGGHAAAQSRPLRIDAADNLVVAVSSPILRRELLFRQKGLLHRLKSLPECGRIRRIVFCAG